MVEASKYQIQPLNKNHNKEVFSCGVEELDQYIELRAGQDKRRCIAATYVLSERDSDLVVGYYTLSATSVELKDLPEKVVKRLPKYPIVSATLLGRLAVDEKYHGNRFGELLLVDALKRSLEISSNVASFSVITEAKNEAVVKFYQRYGFIQLPDYKQRLFLPMATIRQAFNPA